MYNMIKKAMMTSNSHHPGSVNELSSLSPTHPFEIRKNDSRFLSQLQIKKAQFLFENEYFIWNEAELYLKVSIFMSILSSSFGTFVAIFCTHFQFHDIFSVTPDSDLLYEEVCKTTRNVFKLIHDVHYRNTGSNAAHLKFYEVLVCQFLLYSRWHLHLAFINVFFC